MKRYVVQVHAPVGWVTVAEPIQHLTDILDVVQTVIGPLGGERYSDLWWRLTDDRPLPDVIEGECSEARIVESTIERPVEVES